MCSKEPQYTKVTREKKKREKKCTPTTHKTKEEQNGHPAI
jgi:hypothetical protein